MRDRGEDARVTLQGRPLQIMRHAADASQLFAAAGPARPAVDHVGHGRAVARRFLAAVAIDEGDPPVERTAAQHDVAGELGVVAENAHHERALAAIGQRDGVGSILVRHQRGRAPKASTSCTARACHGRSQRKSTGGGRLPSDRSAPLTFTCAGSP